MPRALPELVHNQLQHVQVRVLRGVLRGGPARLVGARVGVRPRVHESLHHRGVPEATRRVHRGPSSLVLGVWKRALLRKKPQPPPAPPKPASAGG